MDLKSISLFSSVTQKMDWLTERQKVLAQNIANADTPGYVPRDLKKISFKSHLDQGSSTGALHMQASAEGHMNGNGKTIGDMGSQGEPYEQISKSSMIAQNGNGVNLEDELTKMAETQMEYATAVNLYRKHVSMMKTAIGKK